MLSSRNANRTGIVMTAITLRELKPDDGPRLERLLSRITVFGKDDGVVAMELIDRALSQPDQKDYAFFIAADANDCPVGYACYGPTPLTEGTFDLYWIAVDPAFSGQGIGTQLLSAVEEAIKKVKGRMLIIETSSGMQYASTRHFYRKNGYKLAETIEDFFREGEDRVTYVKKFPRESSLKSLLFRGRREKETIQDR
jgi:ribosomal protein S18 acetylase RimI-like enzyme